MKTVTVPAKQYEDHDDSLAAAKADYAAEHDLALWQVTASWVGGEDGERDEIALEVPSTVADESGYLVLIAAGHPARYGAKVGWDTVWPTRKEAEECAKRAEKNDGWSAKVVEIGGAS